MNKYLKFKNEEFIKHNSADFYILSIYSSEVLKLDNLRLCEFENFKKGKCDINKLFLNLGISSVLVYRFRSFLIIPVFYLSYFILDYLLGKNANCYFCEKQEIKIQKLNQYESYYNLINYVFRKNKINNFDEFEKELDKIIQDLKH
jgi:hypothetical protein